MKCILVILNNIDYKAKSDPLPVKWVQNIIWLDAYNYKE